MRLLLDTHAFMWWAGDDALLSEMASASISDPANDVYLSAVVPWELSIKIALGKLELPDDYIDLVADGSMHELPISIEHGRAVQDLPLLHGDPFDRMLVAQARCEGLTIVTRDTQIAAYDVPVLW